MNTASPWALLLAALMVLTSLSASAEPVAVRLLAINDLHGQLLPPADPLLVREVTASGAARPVQAGGVAQLATLIKRLAAQSPNHLLVGAGDMIGNSPLNARLLREESTIAILNEMGMAVSSVGNNEFGGGWRELQRLQRGSCEDGGCTIDEFAGARFQYLAANVIENASGKPILPAYAVKSFGDIPVAFIGVTRKNSLDQTKAYNFDGISFRDEVQTINALVPEIRAQGIEAIVVLLHEGAKNDAAPNDCGSAAATLTPLVGKIDKAVDVIITAHTHQAYICRLDGRVVTQASNYGRMLTSIDLLLDPVTRDVMAAQASNHLVETDAVLPDPAVQKLVTRFETQAASVSERLIGTMAAPVSLAANAAGESPIGLLVADSMLAAFPGADVAFVNPRSLRASIMPANIAGKIRYADAFEVLPHGRRIATLSLNGSQLIEVLNLQWKGRTKPAILQPSRGFVYAWRKDETGGSVLTESIRLNGRPLEAQTNYRVVLDASLAEGGEGFETFKAARDKRYVAGTIEYDLLARYLSRPGVEAPAGGRIVLRD
ncbi:MAG TPA: bifunctional metallophosphatase/5'-nucleotidase [Rhodocyclaceae bacterium]|nr:bifunctional metallophosphatase/5'-nucleotidase [Rhodocyclaceae bacterium]